MTDQTTAAAPRRVRVHHLLEAKEAGRPLTMLTAYDGPTAAIFDRAGTDMLLVGDSIGNAMHGERDTLPVTLDELVIATRSVARATRRALVVADLPFGSYEASPEQGFASAVRLMKEGAAHAVKLEGGARMVPLVELLTSAGIPVVGHLGFTPQSEHLLGGKRVQGRGDEAAEQLCQDALALQEAGAVAVVVEMVPAPVAARMTEILRIPTIGIGAGLDCDGQVLVWLDMAGMGDWSPRFAKAFGQVGKALEDAARTFGEEVRAKTFPEASHSFES